MVTEEKRDAIVHFITKDGSTSALTYTLKKVYGKDTIEELKKDGFLVETSISNHFYCTPKEIYEAENEIADLVKFHLNKCIKRYSVEDLDALIDKAEDVLKIKLAYEQRRAVRRAVNSPFFIITGIPGSGKTTVLAVIKMVLGWLGETVNGSMNLAPTGKASKRMSESLGEKSYTVDKRLTNIEYIKERACIIDECSMLDLVNCREILKRAMRCPRLILLGDIYQLASVGFGKVLGDLLSSGVPSEMLNKCFRVSENSVHITHNIDRIRSNNYEFEEGDDFHIFKDVPKEWVNKMLLDEYMKKVGEYGKENVCVLVPIRRREVAEISSERINEQIETYFSKKNGEIKLGSRVMQLENNSHGVNGEIGTVVKCDKDSIEVDFEGKISKYSFTQAKKELTLAYSMSVHKSQGSEYKCVIMACLKQHIRTCNKNLIYTGITRAKNEVVFFYDTECLKKCLAMETSYLRVTLLAERIKERMVA